MTQNIPQTYYLYVLVYELVLLREILWNNGRLHVAVDKLWGGEGSWWDVEVSEKVIKLKKIIIKGERLTLP